MKFLLLVKLIKRSAIVCIVYQVNDVFIGFDFEADH